MGLGSIAGGIGTLLARLKADRADALDALKIGGAYKVTSEEHWTDARAGYLDRINDKFPAGGAVIASSSEVAKATYWTQALATKLGKTAPTPQSNSSVSSLVHKYWLLTNNFSVRSDNSHIDFVPNGGIELPGATDYSLGMIKANGEFGYRRSTVDYSVAVGSYQTIGEMAQGNSGWIWGLMSCCHNASTYHGVKLTIYDAAGNPIVVGESDYYQRQAHRPITLLGMARLMTLPSPNPLAFLYLNSIPLRFNNGFKAELRIAQSATTDTYGTVVWTDDPA